MSRSNSLSDDYDDTILTLRFANLMVSIWRWRNAAQTKKNIYMGVSGEKKRQSIPSDRRLLIPRVKREKQEREASTRRNEESTMKEATGGMLASRWKTGRVNSIGERRSLLLIT